MACSWRSASTNDRKRASTFDVLGPVQGDEKILARTQAQRRQRGACRNTGVVRVDHLFDRVAGHVDPVTFDAFAHQVGAAALGIWHEHRAAVIDDPPVHFFRHAVVVAAVARFHVIHRYAETARDDGRQAAVGVAENQQPIGPMLEQQRLSLLEDLTDLSRAGLRAHSHERIGRSDAELVEKHRAEPLIEVLSGMDEDVIERDVEERDDAREADDLGARAENRQDLHAGALVTRRRRRHFSSSCRT